MKTAQGHPLRSKPGLKPPESSSSLWQSVTKPTQRPSETTCPTINLPVCCTTPLISKLDFRTSSKTSSWKSTMQMKMVCAMMSTSALAMMTMLILMAMECQMVVINAPMILRFNTQRMRHTSNVAAMVTLIMMECAMPMISALVSMTTLIPMVMASLMDAMPAPTTQTLVPSLTITRITPSADVMVILIMMVYAMLMISVLDLTTKLTLMRMAYLMHVITVLQSIILTREMGTRMDWVMRAKLTCVNMCTKTLTSMPHVCITAVADVGPTAHKFARSSVFLS
mmetsp:Transcript_14493/g.20581  ORF Transcript_14493/g.20581 Transcript_14493/m.20581 type:complete len:282 (+) Transcript_14493:524-1369(+)